MQYLKDLIQRYLKGNASREETNALHDWYNSFDDSEVPLPLEPGEDRQTLEQRLLGKLTPLLQETPSRKPRYRPYAIAASIAALIGVAGWFGWQHQHTAPTQTGITAVKAGTDKSPASQKAVLTLADGSTIALDDAANGPLSRQGGANVVKKNKGELSYQGTSPGAEIVYNTLSVPRGGMYQLVLPDGTRVWLNSSSSLRYPTAFNGTERKVTLQGQAYFETTADAAHPFRVQTGAMEVTVLGTRFDLMAYSDEPTISATLAEGRIRVEDKILQPGQQAVLALSNHELSVRNVDVNRIMAWKNGLFVFNNTDLATILREVARWYDVEIVYQAKPGKELYGGGISRRLNLSAVLHVLEENGSNHFKIEGNKVIVTP
jgi:ferric-dicitrate binding protein FerR (iron transport regulator)